MTFRVGQKVVCVDASETFGLVEKQIYTVLAYPCPRHRGLRNRPMMQIDCCGRPYPDGTPCQTWFAERFRPVVERKTDISIFTQMLTPQGVEA